MELLENIARIKNTIAMGCFQPGYIANLNATLANYQAQLANTVVYIPSGMGGVFPALIVGPVRDDNTVQVYCCDPEFFPLWLLTINIADIKAVTDKLPAKVLAMVTKARKLGGVQ